MLPLRRTLKGLTSLLSTFPKRFIMTDIIGLRKGDYIDYNGKAMIFRISILLTRAEVLARTLYNISMI